MNPVGTILRHPVEPWLIVRVVKDLKNGTLLVVPVIETECEKYHECGEEQVRCADMDGWEVVRSGYESQGEDAALPCAAGIH